jgi:hypothetical protein
MPKQDVSIAKHFADRPDPRVGRRASPFSCWAVAATAGRAASGPTSATRASVEAPRHSESGTRPWPSFFVRSTAARPSPELPIPRRSSVGPGSALGVTDPPRDTSPRGHRGPKRRSPFSPERRSEMAPSLRRGRIAPLCRSTHRSLSPTPPPPSGTASTGPHLLPTRTASSVNPVPRQFLSLAPCSHVPRLLPFANQLPGRAGASATMWAAVSWAWWASFGAFMYTRIALGRGDRRTQLSPTRRAELTRAGSRPTGWNLPV